MPPSKRTSKASSEKPSKAPKKAASKQSTKKPSRKPRVDPLRDDAWDVFCSFDAEDLTPGGGWPVELGLGKNTGHSVEIN